MLWPFGSKSKGPVLIVLVLGLAGDGKSTFINSALGETKAATSKKLKPCTTEVGEVVQQRDGQKVVFIDTPGLDLDGDNLTNVIASVDAVLRKYGRKHADAVIYLHRATRKVVPKPPDPKAVTKKFEQVCGPSWKQKVILASTGGVADPAQLKEIYYEELQVTQFNADAWRIIDQVLPAPSL